MYTASTDDVIFTGPVDLDAGAATAVSAGAGAGDDVTFTSAVNGGGRPYSKRSRNNNLLRDSGRRGKPYKPHNRCSRDNSDKHNSCNNNSCPGL